MLGQKPSHYVIATWPDGTELYRTIRMGAGSRQDEQSILWGLEDPGKPGMSIVFELLLKNFDLKVPRKAVPAVKIHTSAPGALMDKAIWVTKLLHQSLHGYVRLDQIPIPLRAKGMVWHNVCDSEAALGYALQIIPQNRPAEWIGSTQALLQARALSLWSGPKIVRVDLDTSLPLDVRWVVATEPRNGTPYTIELSIPPLAEIEQGALPVWVVYGNVKDLETYPEKLLPWPDAAKMVPELSRTNLGIYDALQAAGLVVKHTEYDDWLVAHTDPGKLSDELTLYALLGTPLPPLFPAIEFNQWLEGQP